jgi:hypothetical protein
MVGKARFQSVATVASSVGTLTEIEANAFLTSGFITDKDIRKVYDLGGGGMMDMGCEFLLVQSSPHLAILFPTGYALSVSRYLSGADPTKIIFPPREGLPGLDLSMC